MKLYRRIAECAIVLMGCLLCIIVAKSETKTEAPTMEYTVESIEEYAGRAGISTELIKMVNGADEGVETEPAEELIADTESEQDWADLSADAAEEPAIMANIRESDVEEVAAEETEEIPEEWQNRAMVNTNVDKYVNVREEPNEEASIVGKLYRGAVADIEEKGEEWTKISSGSVEGYVFNEYLAFGLDAEEIAEAEGTWIVTSNEGGLRVREAPSTDARIISALSEGQELHWDTEAETADGWVAVVYKNGTGYVSAEYVTVELDLGEAISIEEERAAIAAAATARSSATLTQGAAIAANYDDVTLLAALIYCEAGNQGDAGRLAVGAVVVNRVWSSAYPNSVAGVIYQSGQFGVASNGTMARCLANGSYSSACISAAQQALSGVTNVGGALHFQGTSSGRSGIVIGAHVFY